MRIADALLPDYDHEMGTTRRLLERVPDEALAWKPHEKSMDLGELATHLADIPGWAATLLDRSGYDLTASALRRDQGAASLSADAGSRRPVLPSRQAVLDRFDANATGARAKLAARSDPELLAPWTLSRDGHELFTVPKVSAFRSFLLNHLIHHRGQLSVYLRLQGVPLPSIYGPTADEPL